MHTIAERGWNPLNQGCLVDPKVIVTKTKAHATATTTENAGNNDTLSSGDKIPDSQETTSSAYLASQIVSLKPLGKVNLTEGA
jgi:hypothetical protein